MLNLLAPGAEVEMLRLVAWEYNDPARTVDGAAMDDLMESIRDYGQVQNIAVIDTNMGSLRIVDGHRRVCALRRLGHRWVKADIYSPDTDFMALLKILNVERRGQGLGQYLAPLYHGDMTLEQAISAVPSRHRRVLREWAAAGFSGDVGATMALIGSPYAIDQAIALVRYMGWSKGTLGAVLDWMADRGPGIAAQVRHAMRAGVPPGRFKKAIAAMSDLWEKGA